MAGEYCWAICKTSGRTMCRSCEPEKSVRKSLRDPATGRLRDAVDNIKPKIEGEHHAG